MGHHGVVQLTTLTCIGVLLGQEGCNVDGLDRPGGVAEKQAPQAWELHTIVYGQNALISAQMGQAEDLNSPNKGRPRSKDKLEEACTARLWASSVPFLSDSRPPLHTLTRLGIFQGSIKRTGRLRSRGRLSDSWMATTGSPSTPLCNVERA
jgi:hypothetical protein